MRIVSAHQRTAEVRAKNTKKWIEKEDIEGLNLNKRISESNICCYNGKEQVNLAVASLVEAWIETMALLDLESDVRIDEIIVFDLVKTALMVLLCPGSAQLLSAGADRFSAFGG